MTPNEKGILEFVLADANLRAGDALRAQIPRARVVDGVPRMPTYLHLEVSSAARSADCPDGKVPVDVVVESPSGQVTGFIVVWTAAGYLSTIEHAWVAETMPEEFPSSDKLRRGNPNGAA